MRRPVDLTHMPPQLRRDARDKRFGWWRCYNDFTRHPKWRIVAAKARVEIAQVVAIAADMLSTANKNQFKRGSLEKFDVSECAIALGLTEEIVARVYAALEHPDIEWIEQDWIIEWHDRQPDKEDPTAAERQRRSRARKRLRALSKANGSLVEHPDGSMSRVTSVTLRDVTLDETRQNNSGEKSAASLSGQGTGEGSSVENSQENDEARWWLMGKAHQDYGFASQLVGDRLAMRRLAADMTIRRWVADILCDYVGLREILTAAYELKVNGQQFQNIVTQMIARRLSEAKNGPALPLPLQSLKREAS